jgi:thiamine-phosphate pyrophosphorylase
MMAARRDPVTLCLITGRHRLCPNASPERVRRCLVDQARFAVAASIDYVQVRENDLPACEIAAIVRAIVAITRGTSTRVIVNDRLDIALACGADGVHLRGDSMPAALIRELTPPSLVIGRAIHSAAEARAAGPVDYLIAGTMFATESKPETGGRDLLGVEGLRAIVGATRTPVLAVGGVTLDRVPAVMAAGAAGLAAIGLFMGRPGPAVSSRVVPLELLVNQIKASV